jgi:hypothetical protein
MLHAPPIYNPIVLIMFLLHTYDLSSFLLGKYRVQISARYPKSFLGVYLIFQVPQCRCQDSGLSYPFEAEARLNNI